MVIHGDETIQTIQVSESGLDTSSCISQDHPCKTLAYVFSQMSYGDFYSSEISKTIINVMYNQTVETLLNFTTPHEHVKLLTKISVVGYITGPSLWSGDILLIMPSSTLNMLDL